MKILFKILIISLFASCSSLQSKDWSDWKHCGVAKEQERWMFCDALRDGQDRHRKGLCYQSLECRTRETMWPFRNIKTETRVKHLFCAWGDLECMDKHKLWPKIIVQPK